MTVEVSAEPALNRTKPRRRVSTTVAEMLGWLVDHFELFAIATLVIAAANPASPPVAGVVVDGTESGFWNFRMFGANQFELIVVAIVALWLIRSLVVRPQLSAYDRWLSIAAVSVIALQAVALPINASAADFLPLDIERLLVPAAAYFLVTRSVKSERAMHTLALLIGGAIFVCAVQLVLVYGITGETQFGTITGRNALLITEDTLLLMFPLVLAWGALLDGRLNIWAIGGVLSMIAFTATVDMLSLRRGALLMIGIALLLRTLPVGWKRISQGAVVCIVGFLLLIAAGPARPIVPDIKYAVQSTLLLTDDSSTSQRTSEIRNLAHNMDESSWLVGRGLGVPWKVVSPTPVDAFSFGSGESDLLRIGWHVYGLDWLYKVGLLGLAALIFVGFKLARLTLDAYRVASPRLKSAILSYGACTPPLLLFAFTNIRVAMMAGITLGLLSCATGFAREDQARTKPKRSTPSV